MAARDPVLFRAVFAAVRRGLADRTAPTLLVHAGQRVVRATRQQCTIDDKQQPYLRYKAVNVIVTSYSEHATLSGFPLPSETLTMNSTEAKWTYIVVDPATGDLTGKVSAKYNPGKGRS